MDQQRIKQILIDQQAEAKLTIQSDSVIRRAQVELLVSNLNAPLAKVILGLRRTGKSTLSIQAVKGLEFIYINFDDEYLGQCRVEDLDLVFQVGLQLNPQVKFWIFDEVQNVEGWELFVNRLLRKKLNIIVTGSNSRLLSGELATHLTGRQISIELLPFSFREFLSFQKVEVKTKDWTTTERSLLNHRFDEYLSRGGLPEILGEARNSAFAKKYIQELYDKILNRDITQRRKIKNVKALREIALYMMSLNSCEFTYQSVRKTVGLNSLSVTKNYIQYIQESFLGFVVDPYSHKVKERISKPKKFYAIDPKISEVIGATSSEDYGRKLENLVYLELRRREGEIYYIKEKNYEVDFALRVGRNIDELLQVCWDLSNPKTRKRELSSLISGAKELNTKKLVVITSNQRESLEIEGFHIEIVPFFEWCLKQG